MAADSQKRHVYRSGLADVSMGLKVIAGLKVTATDTA
jgi:hypothetical protein